MLSAKSCKNARREMFAFCIALAGILLPASTVTRAGMAAAPPRAPLQSASPASTPADRPLTQRYCVGCHNNRTKTAELSLENLNPLDAGNDPEVWERVVRKLRAGVMPPAGRPRPDEATLEAFAASIEAQLDRATNDPGRTETFHRLNRTEYRNAVRDLLAYDADVMSLLPSDDGSYGFDNIAGVLKLSTVLMERYVSTARTISRAVVGRAPESQSIELFRVPAGQSQALREESLGFGTRGGRLLEFNFPLDATYRLALEVTGPRRQDSQLEVSIDGLRVSVIDLAAASDPAKGEGSNALDVRVPVKAGPRKVGVAFVAEAPTLTETLRLPFLNPQATAPGYPSLASITIEGPFDATSAGDTPSRRRIFTCRPTRASEEARCAKSILSTLARRAYRRPLAAGEIDKVLEFYGEGARDGGFEAGIERGVRAILVSPQFLFRIETDPAAPSPSGTYSVSDLELASRLSFFLWSSIPDDELLELATAKRLRQPEVLEKQVLRMLADSRSHALVTNFFGQWLQLRAIDSMVPNRAQFPDFDESLRGAFQRETQLFVESIVRENRSVVDLLTADYTFVNERLAKHYGIPNVKGSHFRRVALESPNRRGLLGHGSVLLVTSHATRTSPVLRGKWVLMNILGTPPPAPPPEVPPLPERHGAAKPKTMREQMAEHRTNAVCATCHQLIDPSGFALEQYDAIGRWRTVDEAFNPIDATGALPDGASFDGVATLRAALTRRPERFVTTLSEKMLTYALGRGVTYTDMPAVRGIVAAEARDGYRFNALIMAIVRSRPFQMRRIDRLPADATARLTPILRKELSNHDGH